MKAIDNLIHRHSTPAAQLSDPRPSDDEIKTLIQAAVSAPDHCNLRPWRFLIIKDEARCKLGQVFADAYKQRDPNVTEEALENYRNKPLRAPLIITVIADVKQNPKVPDQEQVISAACAAAHIQLAAQALGYGSVWLTGINTRDWNINEALGLGFDEKIVGYLYIGTKPGDSTPPPRANYNEVASEWTEPTISEETVI